jgi:hypothetical protein
MTLDDIFALLRAGEELTLHRSADDDQLGTLNVTTARVTISQRITFATVPPDFAQVLPKLLRAARAT